MHHFTLRKLRETNPKELCSLINEFIINAPSPNQIAPKKRIRRTKPLVPKENELKLILKLAQNTGDKYLLSKLGQKLPLSVLKKELIKSIKQNRIEDELWNSYAHALEGQKQNGV
jgi:hypothetical protein